MENPNVRCFVHSHHAGSLFEWHTENYYYENRLKDFEEIKSLDEPPWKIALRKKLFRDITDLLPPELGKAGAELGKAGAELDKAGAELGKAGAELDKARAEWDKARAEGDKLVVEYGVGRLHDEVCKSVNPDCPWDGLNIFGEKE